MTTRLNSRLPLIGALAVIGVVVLLLLSQETPKVISPTHGESQTANVTSIEQSSESTLVPQPEPSGATPIPPTVSPAGEDALLPSPEPEKPASSVTRIQSPYNSPPQSFLTVSDNARLSLVNIFCAPEGSGQAASGSGVIIDAHGVVLTNAHVAQYVLLAQSGRTNLSCIVRSGAPARVIGGTDVLFIPPLWVQKHAKDVTLERPLGTGEHDYALLRIIPLPEERITLPSSFPALPIDTREAIGFPDDQILAASYPSEFVGAGATVFNLYPASSITSVKRLLTFEENMVDLLSLAGAQEAQSGSSGGAIVNAWGHLIGIITTTSEGATTAEREMRALTLSYIDRDLRVQTGRGIAELLTEATTILAENFKSVHEDALVELLLAEIKKRTQ